MSNEEQRMVNPDAMSVCELRLRLKWEEERMSLQHRAERAEKVAWKWMEKASDLMDEVARLKGLK